jgi:hypothetical protein
MFRKRAIRLVVAVLIVAAAYFYFSKQQGHGPVRQDESAPRESPRESPPESTRPEQRGGETAGSAASAAGQVICETQYFSNWTEPAAGSCAVRMRNGYPVPDAKCTPGGVNPSVTIDVLHNPAWRTKTVRNCESSEAQKHVAYQWYEIEKPRVNSNENQVCELDHLVPLELGGSDGLGNIWPQCGPDAVTLNQRYFKQKDHVENYLTEEVKAGRMPLGEAQKGIAKDWTQYLNDADLWCGRTGKC